MRSARLLFALVLLVGLAGCEQKPKSTTEKIQEKVDDALDRRSHEEVRDAAEDLAKAAKKTAAEVEEGAKEVAKEIEKGAQEAAKEIEEAAKKPEK